MALGNAIAVTLSNITTALASFDSLRLYRGVARNGPFTLLTTLPLVAGQPGYQHQDPTGLLTDWTCTSLYNTSTLNESQLTEPEPAVPYPLVSRLTLVRSLANRFSLFGRPRQNHVFPGPSGVTATSASDSITIAAFVNSRSRSRFWEGWFAKLQDGNQAGQEREVSAFDPEAGAFALAQALPGVTGVGAAVDLYGLTPSWWWTERLLDACLDVWVPFRLPIAGIEGQTEYSLPHYVTRTVQVLGMERVQGGEVNEHTYADGEDFHLIEANGGGLALRWNGGLPVGQVVEVRGKRRMPALPADSALVGLDDERVRYLVTHAAQKTALHLAQTGMGSKEQRERWRTLVQELGTEKAALMAELGMFPDQASPRREPMVAIGHLW